MTVRALLSLMALVLAVWAGAQTPQPAILSYAHFDPIEGHAWRVGDRCFADPDVLTRWGWKVDSDPERIEINAEGRRYVFSPRQIAGRTAIDLSDIALRLGAVIAWGQERNTYHMRSLVTGISVSGTTIRVESTLPIRASSFTLDSPERLVIDLKGARLADPNNPGFRLPGDVRVGQFEAGTVRLVVQRPGVNRHRVALPQPGKSLSFDLSKPASAAGEPTPPVGVRIEPLGGNDEASPSFPSQPQVQIEHHVDMGPAPTGLEELVAHGLTRVAGPVGIAESKPGDILFWIGLSEPLDQRATAAYDGPRTVRLTVPYAIPSERQPPLAENELVESFESKLIGSQTVITFNLKGPAGFVLSTSRGAIRLRLVKPPTTDGSLAGKVVVIDPGHGGTDSGAVTPDRRFTEKGLNLSVSRKLSDLLIAEGASVILTRNDDTLIPLTERAEIANRAGADFFISVHHNSNGRRNSTSGNMTFYHKQDPLGLLLATCIQNEIAKASPLPNMGAWSDSRIYRSGFAVLRTAEMPAVLLELGFMNHRSDQAVITSEDYQSRFAEAVVRGLKVYLGSAKPDVDQP